MKRLLAGSSLYLLVLTGYAAPNAGAAFAQGTLFAPGQAKPVYSRVEPVPLSPSNFTLKTGDSSHPELVVTDDMTPTQFVTATAEKIAAAKTASEILNIQNYFAPYHALFVKHVANSNPTTADEKDRHEFSSQVLALLQEIMNCCTLRKIQIETQVSASQSKQMFQKAYAIAKSIELLPLQSTDESQQWFLNAKNYSDRRAQLDPFEDKLSAAPAVRQQALNEQLAEIKELSRFISEQRRLINEQRPTESEKQRLAIEQQRIATGQRHIALAQQRLALAQKRFTPQVTYPKLVALEEPELFERDRTSSSALKDTPKPAKPATSPPESTSKPATPTVRKPVLMAGLIPTEFVATASARITAARTDAQLIEFQNYFTEYYSILLDDVVKANPTTVTEEDRYLTATQIMALLKELNSACILRKGLGGSGIPPYALQRSFENARAIADGIERLPLKSPEERHQWFLQEESYSDERAQLNSVIKDFNGLPLMPDPAVADYTYLLSEIKKLRQEIADQNHKIAQQQSEIEWQSYKTPVSSYQSSGPDYSALEAQIRSSASDYDKLASELKESADRQRRMSDDQRKMADEQRQALERQIEQQTRENADRQRKVEEEQRQAREALERQERENADRQRENLERQKALEREIEALKNRG